MTRLSDIGPAITRVLDDVRARVAADASGAVRAPSPALRAAILERVRSFVGSGLRWHLAVPGGHPSGASNQVLLHVLEAQGRDYEARTVQLAQLVRGELLARFGGGSVVPTLQQLQDAAAVVVLRQVVARVERGGADLVLEQLTPEYARRKARAGKGGRPIGVWSGAWLGALRQARVVWE